MQDTFARATHSAGRPSVARDDRVSCIQILYTTDASTPTDAVNPKPEVVKVQPPVLNRPPSKVKSLQIEAKRKRILLIKKYNIAASGCNVIFPISTTRRSLAR